MSEDDCPQDRGGGDTWRWKLQSKAQPTIMVIEKPNESYKEFHERKNKEEGAEVVPFGFSRVLVDKEV